MDGAAVTGDLRGLFRELVRLEVELWAKIDARLKAECDLPLTWFEIMRLLQQEPRLRVHDVSTTFGITMGGVSKVIDKIEAAGLCQRVPNPEDRRSSLLELTEAGVALVDGALPVFDDELDSRFRSVLDEEELAGLSRALLLLRSGEAAHHEPSNH